MYCCCNSSRTNPVLRCQIINDNQRWLSLAPKDCGVTMQRIVYLIDTYFFDHMHPLSPKMTTKNHFIIGTILKSVTIYHSFSTYWCLYLDKNIRVINPWFQATNALVTNLVVLMSDAIKRIVNTTIFTILFIALEIEFYILNCQQICMSHFTKLISNVNLKLDSHQILIHQTVIILDY